MITPRHFEEMMQEINDNTDNSYDRIHQMIKLMADTLDTLGYAAGTKIYRDGWKNDTVRNS